MFLIFLIGSVSAIDSVANELESVKIKSHLTRFDSVIPLG